MLYFVWLDANGISLEFGNGKFRRVLFPLITTSIFHDQEGIAIILDGPMA